MERLTHQGEQGPYWDKAVFDEHGGMEEDLIIDRLAYYEDMEEQGWLVVLPMVDIGDTIYDIWEARRNGTDEIRKMVVTDIYAHIDKRRRVYFIINGYYFNPDDIGQTVFFDPQSAENALKGGAN